MKNIQEHVPLGDVSCHLIREDMKGEIPSG